eukprot:4869571-Alexandrium_andersonii.AAC.1
MGFVGAVVGPTLEWRCKPKRFPHRMHPRSATGAPAGLLRRQIRRLREQRRRMDQSGASGANFEAAPGPAQLKCRTPEASLHVPLLTGQSNYGSKQLVG